MHLKLFTCPGFSINNNLSANMTLMGCLRLWTLGMNYQHDQWYDSVKHCKFTWMCKAINEHQSAYDNEHYLDFECAENYQFT